LYVGHEEKDGAAQNVADTLVDKLKSNDLGVPTVQNLSDRKAFETVKNMPKGGVALIVVDSSAQGICSAGKKLMRNMNTEIPKTSLEEQGIRYMVLTVANSKDSSAAANKEQVEQNAAVLAKAFESAGCSVMTGGMPSYVDAGIDDPIPVLDEVCKTLCTLFSLPGEKSKDGKANSNGSQDAKTIFLCTGEESQEAAEALTATMGTGCSFEDAALGLIAKAATEGTRVVLLVQCGEEGLSNASRKLSKQLSEAPADTQAQLQKLKFVLITVVATDFGNAGERANARAAFAHMARATEPVAKILEKCGATCVASSCFDLQDSNDDTIKEVCESIKNGFASASGAKPAPAVSAE